MLKRKVLCAALAVTIGTSLVFSSLAMAAATTPTLHNDNPTAKFGDWYTGALPPNASSNKPVILFVQGLHSNYTTWTGSDGYYQAAYNAGYRTAFVQLKDADGSGGDMYTNGKVLSEVIRKVADYYEVPKINIIAHSKGGIDTQTALVYYGASPYVNVVHQLSTPNKGSELADMAYSTWASWLASILGQKDEAVYSLQTSYMANYRSKTDARPENNATKTYMSGGMGDDGMFTSYWFAHAILPGEDDGAVSINSALGLPYGIKSFTKNISHSAMAKASKTWSLVQPKLSLGYTPTTATLAKIQTAQVISNSSIEADRNSIYMLESNEDNNISDKLSLSSNKKLEYDEDLILRGGEINGNESVSVPLESGISSVALEVMTSKNNTELKLISPSGRVYTPKAASASSDPDAIFDKAVSRVFQISKPEAGNWSIKLKGKEDAYFAIARIDAVNKTKVKPDKKVFLKGQSSKLSVNFGKKIKGSVKHPKISKSHFGGNAKHEFKSLEETTVDGNVEMSFVTPKEPGIYNLSFDVEGVNDKGEKLVRSINYNFAVTDDQGNIK